MEQASCIKCSLATGLLHKEIIIHHTTRTQVETKWVTIHPQVLVAAVDSTACPPSFVFEVTGCTQCFWVSPPQKLGCDVNKSKQSFHFCSSGRKKKEKMFYSFFCDSLFWGTSKLHSATSREESPRQETTTTQHSR